MRHIPIFRPIFRPRFRPIFRPLFQAFAAILVAALILGSGALQHTRFQLFDTQADLGLICEIAEGEPLVPDRIGPS